jgi:hypothetical protein
MVSAVTDYAVIQTDIDFHLSLAAAAHNSILISARLPIQNLLTEWINGVYATVFSFAWKPIPKGRVPKSARKRNRPYRPRPGNLPRVSARIRDVTHPRAEAIKVARQFTTSTLLEIDPGKPAFRLSTEPAPPDELRLVRSCSLAQREPVSN